MNINTLKLHLLILLALFIPFTVCHADKPSLHDTSRQKNTAPSNGIVYGIDQNQNILDAIVRLAASSNIPINIEILAKYNQPLKLIIPNFSIKQGSYKPNDILQKLALACSQFTWTQDDNCIIVKIRLSNHINNPFDKVVNVNTISKMSAESFIALLNQSNPTLGLEYNTPMMFDQVINPWFTNSSPSLGAQMTSVSISRDKTIANAFNEIGVSLHARWLAVINDTNPMTLTERKNGKQIVIYSNNDYIPGRANIEYYSVKSPKY